MLNNLYRFLFSYVDIVISGRKSGRFINLCTHHKMKIWNLKTSSEDGYFCSMYISDFQKIRPLVHKTRVHVRIIQRHGLRFLLFRYRKRIWFPVMFLLVCGLLVYASGFIWKIEIEGNSYLSDQILISYLMEQGQGFGSAKKDLDCSAIELSLRQDFSQIIWASSYVEGTKLVIEIQENLKQEASTGEEEYESAPRTDLIAQKDATIVSIITRNGTPCVKEGDEVAAGEPLVVGAQEILDDNGEVVQYLYCHANADVTGYVTYDYTDTISELSTKTLQTGKISHSFFVEILGCTYELPWFSPKYEYYDTFEEYHQMQLSPDFYLPIFFGRKTYVELEQSQEILGQEEAKLLANQHFSQFLKEMEENGVSIIDKNVMMKKEGQSYTINGTVVVCEPIGQTVCPQDNEIQEEGMNIDEYE